MTAPQKPLTLSSLAGLILLPGVLILAACGTGPDVETFTIRANYPGPVPGTEILPVTLQVKPLSAPTLYGDQRFIWRSSAETRALKTMDKRLWSEAPPRLIQTEIMMCLSASKVVESVIPADVQVDFDYALSGEVRELLVETQWERHQAIVAFDVFVTQRRPRRLLWS